MVPQKASEGESEQVGQITGRSSKMKTEDGHRIWHGRGVGKADINGAVGMKG